MTNGEYLSAALGKFGVSEGEQGLILINQSIDPQGQVSVNEIKLAIYKEFASIIPIADISEGGYSQRWNLEAIKIWYSQLANDLGLEDLLAKKSQDEISDASWRW